MAAGENLSLQQLFVLFVLYIQIIEKEKDKLYLSQMKEKQVKQLISIITKQKDKRIEFVYNKNISKEF